MTTSALPAFSLEHNTEFERLWITTDPEFTVYHHAFKRLRRHSLQAPEFFILLARIWSDIPSDHDKFEMIPYRTFADAHRAMHKPANGSEPVAIARAGIVLSCRK
jgi:hypothetical protein